ncbi:MAG: hypothetical protein P8X95_08200 [Anaerolineales bacterium]
MGRSLLFILNLPNSWHLAPGVSHPEVNAVARRNEDDRVVVNGNAWYVIYEGERGWALEFTARIRPLSRNDLVTPVDTADGEPVSISAHPARVSWKTKRRGLPWQRHDVRYMTVSFNCQHTERRLNLEFSGWCPQEGFEEILRALRFLKCH